MNTKYPKECFSALKTDQTFSVTGAFFAANGKGSDIIDPVPPYKIYHPSFSFFKISILSRKEDGYDTASGNIRVGEVPILMENSKVALQMDQLSKLRCVSETWSASKWLISAIKKLLNKVDEVLKKIDDLFYFFKHRSFPQNGHETVQGTVDTGIMDLKIKADKTAFPFGNLKGRTPFSVLVEKGTDPKSLNEQRSLLQGQRDFLEGQLMRFKKNQVIIDAIDAALGLLDQAGNLKPGVLDAKPDVQKVLHEQPGNTVPEEIILHAAAPKGNKRKEDPNTGLSPTYEIQIKWTIGNMYPVEVMIRNYMAPIKTSPTGGQQTEVSKMDSSTLVVNTFRLSSEQWFNCLYVMEANMRRFEILYAKAQFSQADLIVSENKEKAEQEKARA